MKDAPVKTNKITVQNIQINITSYKNEDFICLTDMANGKQSESRAADVIKNWLRNRYTIEFLGTWEQISNLILKWSNLTTLKLKPVYQVLCSAFLSGLKKQAP